MWCANNRKSFKEILRITFTLFTISLKHSHCVCIISYVASGAKMNTIASQELTTTNTLVLKDILTTGGANLYV